MSKEEVIEIRGIYWEKLNKKKYKEDSDHPWLIALINKDKVFSLQGTSHDEEDLNYFANKKSKAYHYVLKSNKYDYLSNDTAIGIDSESITDQKINRYKDDCIDMWDYLNILIKLYKFRLINDEKVIKNKLLIQLIKGYLMYLIDYNSKKENQFKLFSSKSQSKEFEEILKKDNGFEKLWNDLKLKWEKRIKIGNKNWPKVYIAKNQIYKFGKYYNK